MTYMTIDRTASTVEIAGRTFPAVALICPPVPDSEYSEEDLALAAGRGDQSVYIPAENGVLFRVEEKSNERYHGLDLSIDARTCERSWAGDEWLYLPWEVGLLDGELITDGKRHSAAWDWRWAEPDWVVETIDRLARKPFQQPEGEPVRLVRLDYFAETSER